MDIVFDNSMQQQKRVIQIKWNFCAPAWKKLLAFAINEKQGVDIDSVVIILKLPYPKIKGKSDIQYS